MWPSLLTIGIIAVASNLDNAGVGIAYGVRKIRISFWANAMIAVISGVATYLAGVVGHAITHYVPAATAQWIGALVIILVGLWVLSEPWRSRRRNRQLKSSDANVVTRILRDPVEADFDQSQSISLPEAMLLGVALAINALVGGFDAGVVHIDIIITALSVALFSYLLLGLSAYLGSRYAAAALGDKATVVAGLLLMFIGIHQLL